MGNAQPRARSQAVPGEAVASRSDAVDALRARAVDAQASGESVPSPCISVCRIRADTGWCEGCFRTLGEISAWSRSGPEAQRSLWRTLVHRAENSA